MGSWLILLWSIGSASAGLVLGTCWVLSLCCTAHVLNEDKLSNTVPMAKLALINLLIMKSPLRETFRRPYETIGDNAMPTFPTRRR